MALRAHHANAEENLRSLLHGGLGIARHAVEVGRGIVIGAAARLEHFAHHAVVGLVLRDGIADPLAELVGALLAEVFPVILQQVSPLQGPVIDKRGARDQLVDQGAALGFGRVGGKGAHLGRGWQLPGEVERDAAQEACIVHHGRRLDLQALQLGIHRTVDVIILRQGLPGEARLGIHDGHRQRGQVALIAQHDGSLTGARALHRGVGNSRHIGDVAIDYREGGDIARTAVRIDRGHLDGRRFAGRLHEDFLGLDFQAADGIGGGIAERDALRDPVVNGLVISAADVEAQAAAMRHFLGWLSEHEAASRVGAIEPPAREIVEQGLVIELRIVAAQGELEAVLALGRAVTRSRGAAYLIEDGRYVAQECDLGRVGGEGRGDEKEGEYGKPATAP